MGVTSEKGGAAAVSPAAVVRLLAGLGVFFENRADVDALARVAFDVVLGDQRLRGRDHTRKRFPATRRSAASIATSPVSTGKLSTVPVSSPARIEA